MHALVLASLLSCAPILTRNADGVVSVVTPGRFGTLEVYRHCDRWYPWEGSGSRLTVARGAAGTSLLVELDVVGPYWWVVLLELNADGTVYASRWSTSEPCVVRSRCYGSWDELLEGRDDVSDCSRAVLRRCGVRPPDPPRPPSAFPAWVGRGLTKHPDWRVRERGWSILNRQ